MAATKKYVVHCKREPFDVYIGRGSKWGNPFKIGRDGTREEVIDRYRIYLVSNQKLMSDLPELQDKVLGCWCAPKACHGDVLAFLVAAFVCRWCGKVHVGGPENCQS